MGKPTTGGKKTKGRLTAANKKAFLRAYRKTGNITSSAKSAKICNTSFYNMAKRDEAFAADCAAALDEYADSLELEADRRAREGVEDPVFYQGQQVATRLKYSDSLLALLLCANRPAKFARNQQQQVVVGGEVQHIHKLEPEAQRRQAMEMGERMSALGLLDKQDSGLFGGPKVITEPEPVAVEVAATEPAEESVIKDD